MRINPEAGLCSHLLAASTSPTTNSGNTAVRQASLRAHHLLAFPLGLPACCATLPVSNLNCNLKRTMASSSRPNQNIGRILLSEKGGEWQPFSSYGRWACLASDNVPSLHGHVFFFFFSLDGGVVFRCLHLGTFFCVRSVPSRGSGGGGQEVVVCASTSSRKRLRLRRAGGRSTSATIRPDPPPPPCAVFVVSAASPHSDCRTPTAFPSLHGSKRRRKQNVSRAAFAF